jgi:hypothetical protein
MRSSLSAHVRAPEQHAALPFHPECPICRDERLVGTLPPASLISPRGQAALAASVLAFSAVAPAAAVAQELEQRKEGTAAPEVAGPQGAESPDFDPGGSDVALPEQPTPVTAEGGPTDVSDSEEAIEPEAEIEAPVAILDGGDQAADPVAQPSPPAAPAPASSAPVAPPPAPAPSPPAAQAPSVASLVDGDYQARRGDRPHMTGNRTPLGQQAQADASIQTVSSQSSNAETTTPSAAEADPVERVAAPPRRAPAAGRARDRLDRSDRVYVVREGDSLWSIAADRLGRGATVAAIAREVNRLWELNGDRIATGDRDLLMAGTRLVLR